MKFIPWYLKILIKIILSRLPLNYSFWQKIGLFRHGHMEKVDYIIKVFERHINFAELDKNRPTQDLLVSEFDLILKHD